MSAEEDTITVDKVEVAADFSFENPIFNWSGNKKIAPPIPKRDVRKLIGKKTIGNKLLMRLLLDVSFVFGKIK